MISNDDCLRVLGAKWSYAGLDPRTVLNDLPPRPAIPEPWAVAIQKAVQDDERQHRAAALMQGIKVDQRQFGGIFAIARYCARSLAMDQPQVYVLSQASKFNCYCLGNRNQGIVIMTPAMIEELSPDYLIAILGHEMGHLLLGDYAVSKVEEQYVLKIMASEFGEEGDPPDDDISRARLHELKLTLRAASREREIAADRIALLLTQDLEAKIRAILAMVTQSRLVAESVDVESFLEEHIAGAEFTAGAFAVAAEMTHPFPAERIRALQAFEAGPYQQILTAHGVRLHLG